MVIRAFEVEIGGQLVPNSCCFMLFRSSLLKCKKIRVNDAKGCQSWNGDLSLVSSCAVYALAGSCAKTTYDKVCLLMVGLSINQKRDVPWCAQFYQQMSHKNQPSWGIWRARETRGDFGPSPACTAGASDSWTEIPINRIKENLQRTTCLHRKQTQQIPNARNICLTSSASYKIT